MARYLDWETMRPISRKDIRLIRLLVLILTASLSAPLLAQDGTPLTFQNWKDQQVLDAQNGLLRVSARISQLKNGKGGTSAKESAALPANSKLKKAEVDTVSAAERDLRRAQESLQAANNLNLDDYVAIYLPTLRDQPEAIQQLGQKLSKDELVEILKGLVRKDGPPDAKRSGLSMTDGLNVSSRAKAP